MIALPNVKIEVVLVPFVTVNLSRNTTTRDMAPGKRASDPGGVCNATITKSGIRDGRADVTVHTAGRTSFGSHWSLYCNQ